MNFSSQRIFPRLDVYSGFSCINSLQMQENGDDKFLVESMEFIERWGGFQVGFFLQFYKIFLNILLKDACNNFLI